MPKPRKQPHTRHSPIRAQIIFIDELSADGHQTRKHCGFGGGDMPRYRYDIKPATWQQELLDHARSAQSDSAREHARKQLVGHAEEMVGRFIARRRSYDAGDKIALVANLVVDEALHPSRLATNKQVCLTIGISVDRYDQKRKSGFAWKDDIEHVRQFWLDCFLRGKLL